jgi:hypothetical protein
MRLRRIDWDSGWFGRSKWGIEVEDNIIGGQIATREDHWYGGNKRKIWTAFYPCDGEYKSKEFIKFKGAKEWLIKELEDKWKDS